MPPDKIDYEEEEQEEEDSDRTITVSESTSGEGVKIVKGDGTELSLKQLLKLVGRSKSDKRDVHVEREKEEEEEILFLPQGEVKMTAMKAT